MYKKITYALTTLTLIMAPSLTAMHPGEAPLAMEIPAHAGAAPLAQPIIPLDSPLVWNCPEGRFRSNLIVGSAITLGLGLIADQLALNYANKPTKSKTSPSEAEEAKNKRKKSTPFINQLTMADRKTTATKLTGIFAAATLPALLGTMWYKHQFLNDLRQLCTQWNDNDDTTSANEKARTLVKLMTGQAPERYLDDQDKEGFLKVWQNPIEKYEPHFTKVIEPLQAKYDAKSASLEEDSDKNTKLERYGKEVLNPQLISGSANTETNALTSLALNVYDSSRDFGNIYPRTPSYAFDWIGRAYADGRQDD